MSEPPLAWNVAVSAIGEPDKAGWVTKQGANLPTWKRRWLILKGDRLWYFSDPNGKSPKGALKLDPRSSPIKSGTTFEINGSEKGGSSRVLKCKADTEQVAEEWAETLRVRIAEISSTAPGRRQRGVGGTEVDQMGTPAKPPQPVPLMSAMRLFESEKLATSNVDCCAITADGSTALSGSNMLILWGMKDGAELHSFPVSSASTSSTSTSSPPTTLCQQAFCQFSPDGQSILASQTQKKPCLLNTQSGEIVCSLPSHTDVVRCASFSPDGACVITGSLDKVLRLTDTARAEEITTFKHHTEPIWSCCYSKDGTTIASGSADKTVRLWDGRSDSQIACLTHPAMVYCCAFSPDGRQLVSGTSAGARVWDVRAGSWVSHFQESAAVRCCCYSPDGTKILIGTKTELQIYSAQDFIHTMSLMGHSDQVTCCVFTRDNTKILSGGHGNPKLALWASI